MPANAYHFITHWRVSGTVDEVDELLADPLDLPRWWPSVYLDVRELEPGHDGEVGRRIELFTRGWLPYTLRWQFTISELNRPHGFTLIASGDFVGRGIWTFEQAGDRTIATYDWKLSAEKPLLRRLSFLLKPFFAANHRWAMRQGEKSLQIELDRRHAMTPEARAGIPPPPGPSRLRPAPLATFGAAAAAAAGLLLLRRRRH